MSKFSEFVKTQKEKDEKFFYGENVKHVSNQYLIFTHAVDDDNIIITTNNIKMIKGHPVLIVDNNKGVYLKDWQVRKAHNYDVFENFYVVKLNRKFFRAYTFGFNFENYSFEKEDDFDALLNVAREQDVANLKIASGWMYD